MPQAATMPEFVSVIDKKFPLLPVTDCDQVDPPDVDMYIIPEFRWVATRYCPDDDESDIDDGSNNDNNNLIGHKLLTDIDQLVLSSLPIDYLHLKR